MHSTTVTHEINASSSTGRDCQASKCTGGCEKAVPIAAITPGRETQRTNPIDYQWPLVKPAKIKQTRIFASQ